MKVDERNPLAWPDGFPRTKHAQESKFGKHTVHQAIEEVIRQLELLRAESCTLTANAFIRSSPADKGAAVYFKLQVGWDGKSCKPILRSYVIPCDKWNKLEHNFWAIAKHIEAMRGQQRWGCGNLERDFAGYAALPEKTSAFGPWHEVLGVPENASPDTVKEAYRAKAKLWHPDAGGSEEKMAALNKAYDEANKSVANAA
jgi:hypothetical protein